MICPTCYRMLRGQKGRRWRGTYDLQFDHHSDRLALQQASEIGTVGCTICVKIWNELQRLEFEHDGLQQDGRRHPGGRRRFVSAFLAEVPKQRGLYRLDFKLNNPQKRLATFLLQQTTHDSDSQIYTPLSTNTNSEEVLQLARFWIRKCTQEHACCPSEDFYTRNPFYPTRLIELPPSKNDASDEQTVRLIPRENVVGDDYYVTLSHRWGKAKFRSLNLKDQAEFYRGIKVKTLPRTFQDALDFARRLSPRVKYLWIDSLCIIQDDPQDWARESVSMYEVYRNSYCNVSATGAKDNDGGLYFDRDPEYLWEDQVNLNTEGIPKLQSNGEMGGRNFGLGLDIRRCNILDASFWSDKVDHAHINKRGWVLQERLLAPRVLHFCHGQVAWECRQLDAAECLPHGVPSMEISFDNLKVRTRPKTLLPDEYGPMPLDIDHLSASDRAHEDWKRIVDRYSTYELTKRSDTLIALAGIAELMSTKIPGRYVAGMWEKYLASQLLWRVDPVYENGQFKHPSRRPRDPYQAPTFSWAAINAPQGIKCGETKGEDELLISVEKIHVKPKTGSSFGLVEPESYVELICCLKSIEISKFVTPDGQYSACLQLHESYEEVVRNLYLDSPEDDFHELVGRRGSTYCAPAYEDQSNFLICLILQLVPGTVMRDIGVYRRVGLIGVPWSESWDLGWMMGSKKMIRII